jgi:hypothetical protein
MPHCVQPGAFLRRRNRRQDKRKRILNKMAAMRAAKARKRLLNPPPERIPKMEPWHRFEFGVRDKVQGPAGMGEAWTDFRSIRDVVRRLKVIRKHCGQ